MKFAEKISQLRENAEILPKTKSYQYEESLRLSLNIYNIIKDFTKEEFEDLLKTIEEEKVEGIALKNFLIYGCADFDPDITDQEDINHRSNYLDRLIDQEIANKELYPEGPVSLTLAVRSRSPEIVNLLINTKKANPQEISGYVMGMIDIEIDSNDNQEVKDCLIQILKYIVEAIDYTTMEEGIFNQVLECYRKNVIRSEANNRPELHWAVKNGSVGVVKMFLRARGIIDVNSKDSLGKTPLHLALERRNDPMVKGLIKVSADINSQDNNSNTPLHTATELCNAHLVQIFLEKGAKIDVMNKNYQTPMHLAKSTLQQLDETKKKPRALISQNHSVITSSIDIEHHIWGDTTNLNKIIKLLEEAESKTKLQLPARPSLPRKNLSNSMDRKMGYDFKFNS